jgi:hypothetical protein
LDADGRPYAEHANIIGWRDIANTPDAEQKHYWIDRAQRMARHFFVLTALRLIQEYRTIWWTVYLAEYDQSQ